MSKLKDHRCAKCGAELAAFATEGFCSACLLEHGVGTLDAPAGPATERATSAASEAPGDRIDRYKLLQQIGEGGCGVVYMAEQTEPVRRRVALKVIKLGMDTRQVIGRFEAERQALALMDHPNIAKVLDAGATATGRPYFVMELVKGIRITDYCDQNHLSTRQRLDLFTQVCQAIQHAHQKGIIHRDIKPSNILVTLHDGVPVPKVIDFGIAKATEQPLTEKTVFTALGQFMGTPAYMSPEQAELSGLDIDTRSDIYALGVLLYELLTGRTPFDAKELWQAGLDEMRRRIREEEPVRPSTRLSTMADADLTQVAQHRQSEPAKLTRFLRGDLDWIVMKCLEKDRTRRYETANGLVTDLRRHLDNEPVLACPPSAAYRFQKLVRRNKLGFAAVSAVAAALVIGLGIATWQFFEKSKAYNRAVAAEKQAGIHAEAEASQRKLAEVSTGKAEQATKLATLQRIRAEQLAEENRLNLYAANIKVSEQMLKAGDARNGATLLDSLRPNPGQSDLRGFEWYYLWQQYRSERFTLPHPFRALGCAFSPDGKVLATAGEKGVVRLSNATNGIALRKLSGHANWVTALAFSPDGRKLAAIGEDGAICLWDMAGSDPPEILRATPHSLMALAFSPDGSRLAVGEGRSGGNSGNPYTTFAPPSPSGQVFVWNTRTRQLLWSSSSQSTGVRSLAFSPDGRSLASGGLGNSINLHDAESGRVLATQRGFDGPVFGITFLAHGTELAAASWFPYHESGGIKIFDAATLELKRTLVEKAGKILSLTLSPDGKKLAGGGVDQIARVWEAETGTELATFSGNDGTTRGATIAALSFSPDGRTLASGGWDGVTRVWDVEGGATRQRIRTSNSFSVAFSPDGLLLACAARSVEVRDVNTGKLRRILPEYLNVDIRVAFAPDGSVLAATGVDGKVHFWDVETWRHWTPSQADSDATVEIPLHFEPDSHFAFSPDSRTLVMGGHDKVIRFWDVKSGRLKDAITNASSFSASVAFAHDGRSLVYCEKGKAKFWDVATKQVQAVLGDAGELLRVSPDGRWLASGKRVIELRDLASMKKTFSLQGHNMAIYGLAFSHDSRDIATASWDGTVKIWHVATGQELLTVPSNVGVVWGAAFAPGDRIFAFACGSSTKESGEVVVLRAAHDSKTDSPSQLVPLLSARTETLARQSRWSEAAENLSRVLEFQPTNSSHFHRLAPLFVAAGQLEQYHRLCQAIQAQFAQTKDSAIAERMAKACLILPAPGVDFGIINEMVRIAMTANPEIDLFRYAQFVSGLAAYRQGNYANALEAVRPILAKTTPDPNLDFEVWMVTAMALHGLHQTNEARTAFAQGLAIQRAKLPKLAEGELGGYWNDWIISRALSREAQAIIDGKVTDPFTVPK